VIVMMRLRSSRSSIHFSPERATDNNVLAAKMRNALFPKRKRTSGPRMAVQRFQKTNRRASPAERTYRDSTAAESWTSFSLAPSAAAICCDELGADCRLEDDSYTIH